MYFLGFSINNFTLLALTLAIGIVVDDAIIVLENAYRHQEELGESPEEAAINGTREIGFAVHRHHHLAGRGVHPARVPQGVDRPPVQRVRHRRRGLGGHLGLRRAHAHARCSAPRSSACPSATACCTARSRTGSHALAAGYARTLRAAVRHRWAGRGLGACCSPSARPVVFRTLKREFVPPEDKGWFFNVHHRARGLVAGVHRRVPAAGRGDAGQDQGRRELLQRGEHRRRREPRDDLHQPGGLRPSARARSRTSSARSSGSYFGIPGVFAFANNPPAFGFGSPVNFVIQNPDFDLLVQGNDTLLARARQVKGLVNVDSDLRVNKPELDGELRPRPRRGPRRARGRRRHDAPGAAGRQPDQHVHPEQQAVRRHRAARSARAGHAERHDRPLRPRPGRRAGQARGAGQREGGRGAARAQPLQPGARLDPHRRPGARASRSARRSTRSTASPTRCCPRAAAPRSPASRASWRRAARRSTSRSCSPCWWCSWCWRASSSRWSTRSPCCWPCRSR